jgi:hypothetical protein
LIAHYRSIFAAGRFAGQVAVVRPRDAVEPFEGFHRAVVPKLFQQT